MTKTTPRRTQRFSYLVTSLKMKSKIERNVAMELRTIMVNVEADNESAQQTNIRLAAELSSERDAHDAPKLLLQRAQADLRWWRTSLMFPVLTVCPAPTKPKAARVPKRAARKPTRRSTVTKWVPRRTFQFNRIQRLYRN